MAAVQAAKEAIKAREAKKTAKKTGTMLRSGRSEVYTGQRHSDEISGSGVTVKSAPGRLAAVVVLVTGSTAGTIYDNTAASGTRLYVTSAAQVVGRYAYDGPFVTGLHVVPGTGQTLLLIYS